MIRHIALLGISLVSSCSVGNLPSPYADLDLGLQKQLARDTQYRANYASSYAGFRCAENDLPAVQLHPFSLEPIRPLALSGGLTLRLKAGGRVDQPEKYLYRSESRYVLSGPDDQEIARAESMMTKTEDGAGVGRSKVVFTPLENCVLVEEETFGAGSMIRHIVFMPEQTRSESAGGMSLVWRVFHLNLPNRSHVGEGEHMGTVHGISRGKIYVEMDGAFYAFPLEKFLTTELGISIG